MLDGRMTTTIREGENNEDNANPSKKTMTDNTKPMIKVLIFGGRTGWIGQLMVELLTKEGEYSVL
jgi:hypothetical protein